MITLKNIVKIYERGKEQVRALDSVSFTVNESEFDAVFGPSGAGKTTLLNLIGSIDLPSDGSVSINGNNLTKRNLVQSRRRNTGHIFADFYLVPTLTAIENVMMPQLWTRRVDPEKARELLDLVGLNHRINHYPKELSGGEMQRVAIARSLVNDPLILLADEPTANLDTLTRDTIINLFKELNKKKNLTILLATHDHDLLQHVERTIRLEDGRIIE